MLLRKTWLQFGSGALIFLLFCIAGFFAGYRWGYEIWQEYHIRNLQTSRSYYVGDILTPDGGATELDALVDLIKDQVSQLPQGDQESEIRFFSKSSSLVVKQTGDGHEQISTLLDGLRGLNTNSE